MDSIPSFHQATGGHYITMLLVDWSISTSHYPFALQFLWRKMLWNPSITKDHATKTDLDANVNDEPGF